MPCPQDIAHPASAMDADVEMLLSCEQSGDDSKAKDRGSAPTSIARRSLAVSSALLVLCAVIGVALGCSPLQRASIASGASELVGLGAAGRKVDSTQSNKTADARCFDPGEDCRSSRCCNTLGFACYQKNEYFATCRSSCPKDWKDPDDGEKWSCEQLGDPAPMPGSVGRGVDGPQGNATDSVECHEAGEDCSSSKCCSSPGFACFQKDESFASCRSSCPEGTTDPDDGTEWSCKQLGEPARVPEGPGKCAWSGENCISLKCCNDEGMQCVTQDEGYASCKLEAPEGWEGAILGQFRGYEQEVPAAGPGEPALGSRLFCIAVKSPNGRVSEDAMLSRQEELGVGVFGCDENMVLEGKIAEKSEWDSVRNIDVFIYIWKEVIEDGRFRTTDWTVKSDPDAVFFPQRLKRRLEKLGAPAGQPVYVRNTEFKFGFMGSLEVFTSSTLELYSKHGDQCSDHIGHEGGEDFFFKVCFDALGVGSMPDFDIMYDKYTKTERLILTDVSSCSNADMASFHPYRDPAVWEQCYQTAKAAEEGPDAQRSAWEGGDDGDAQGSGAEDGGDFPEVVSFQLQS